MGVGLAAFSGSTTAPGNGVIVGVAEAASVPLVGAGYHGAVAFLVLIAVLVVKPTGLFGQRE